MKMSHKLLLQQYKPISFELESESREWTGTFSLWKHHNSLWSCSKCTLNYWSSSILLMKLWKKLILENWNCVLCWLRYWNRWELLLAAMLKFNKEVENSIQFDFTVSALKSFLLSRKKINFWILKKFFILFKQWILTDNELSEQMPKLILQQILIKLILLILIDFQW